MAFVMNERMNIAKLRHRVCFQNSETFFPFSLLMRGGKSEKWDWMDRNAEFYSNFESVSMIYHFLRSTYTWNIQIGDRHIGQNFKQLNRLFFSIFCYIMLFYLFSITIFLGFSLFFIIICFSIIIIMHFCFVVITIVIFCNFFHLLIIINYVYELSANSFAFSWVLCFFFVLVD